MPEVEGIKDDFKVVIYPKSMTDFGYVRTSRNFLYDDTPEGQKKWERDMEARCEEIEKDIRRHVDSVGNVVVEYTQHYVCSFCGAEWTAVNNQYNDGCCEEDENLHLTSPSQSNTK